MEYRRLGRSDIEGSAICLGSMTWDTPKFLQFAPAGGFPRAVSIQNEYSPSYRSHDLDPAEPPHHQQAGLLPCPALACGLLSDKDREGAKPEGSRMSFDSDLYGRGHDDIRPVVDTQAGAARKHGIDPAHMAIDSCSPRPLVTSSIIGAAGIEQRATDPGAADLELGAEVLEDNHPVYRRYPVSN